MSAGIIPDVYRHTARKSTVSKTIKSTSICSPQNLNLSHLNISFDEKQLQTTNSINKISTAIKLQGEIPRETYILQRDNEVEQMIIDENHELIIRQILDEIIETLTTDLTDQIEESSSQNSNTTIIRNQDINQLMSTMLNTIYPNDSMRKNNPISSLSNKTLDDIKPMENERVSLVKDQSSSGNKQNSQEMKSTKLTSPQSCSCQCHSSTDDLNDDFIQFKQALRQIRTEQEHERSLNNNPLIQTLKRQHDELMSFYERNKKASRLMSVARVDRAQQTIRFNSYDSQIQADPPASVSCSRSSAAQKPTITSTTPTQTMNNNQSVSATRIHPLFHPSNSTPAIRPRQPVNSSSNATSSSSNPPLPVKTRKSAPSPSNATTNGHSPTTTMASRLHDVVDLTEEDEDDISTRPPTLTSAATRQTTSSATVHSSTTSTATTTTTTTTTISSRKICSFHSTNLRSVSFTFQGSNNRSNHPIGASLSAQAFPLRPLPEHNPCDLSIARPQLSITQENISVRLTWNLVSTPMESIQNYEIYAYKQNATVTNSDWKKIGTVKSMRLPMAVTLKEFQANSHYAFAVRAVSINNQIGPFCEPKTIFTGNNPVQPLHTSQLLNVST